MNNKKPKVSIANLLYRHSPRLLVFAVVVGALAGALYSLIIPFVLRQLNGASGADAYPVGLFFAVCVAILLTKAASVILVNNIAKTATAELRIGIARKINKMMIDNVEGVGFARLLNILIDDVNNVAAAAIAIPMILVSVVTVIGMLGYLAVLNVYVFGVVVLAIVFGVLLFELPASLATGLYEKARGLRDVIQEGVRGLVMGAYELKLNSNKSQSYIADELAAPQHKSVKLEKMADAMIHLAGTSSDLLSFFIIGIVVFILPRYMDLPVSNSYGVVMALLYIAGPVAAILAMMQQLKKGEVAIARIHQLEQYGDEVQDTPAGAVFDGWTEFGVQDVSYAYPAQASGERGFALAPASLSFRRGQVNFIVGGNGSGKSTLSKLLSLHYRAAQGKVHFDGAAIDANNIGAARARIAVIYSNYYLFSKLYRDHTAADTARIGLYLERLGLKGKTEFVDGRFTTTKLSDGQRRRLALLIALLEDKDIYIFDEWAADQDPQFKQVFYEQILADMKRDNKLVIVITHDDRYFDFADRVIHMEDGKVIDVQAGPARMSLSA
jgi:putative pyoverdin transport system ATP-binding/permease protein